MSSSPHFPAFLPPSLPISAHSFRSPPASTSLIRPFTSLTRRTPSPFQMRFSRNNPPNIPPPVPDRVLSTLPYLIPLLDSLTFGKYVFTRVPLIATLLSPLYPLYTIYRGIPFLAFGIFLALFILVVRNSAVSRYIRFNTYQALILDIALLLPQLFQGINFGGAIPPQVVEVCSTAVFYAIAFAFVYAVVANARGRLPDEIPGVSDSVNQQLGPF